MCESASCPAPLASRRFGSIENIRSTPDAGLSVERRLSRAFRSDRHHPIDQKSLQIDQPEQVPKKSVNFFEKLAPASSGGR
ncbi:hypothetical protein V3H18_07325 [Methylocystis sp. 9N]|uniref:Uncharacterized protein n=1 Tax=Methylocystis borbori TaxID=3118750 RepID=A0ABU7XIM8_9HYPH